MQHLFRTRFDFCSKVVFDAAPLPPYAVVGKKASSAPHQLFLCAGSSGKVFCVDIVNRQHLIRFAGHQGDVRAIAVCPSLPPSSPLAGSGKQKVVRFASGGDDCKLVVIDWDVGSGSDNVCTIVFEGRTPSPITALAFTAGGDLAVGTEWQEGANQKGQKAVPGAVSFWKLQRDCSEYVNVLSSSSAVRSMPDMLLFSPDETALLVVSDNACSVVQFTTANVGSRSIHLTLDRRNKERCEDSAKNCFCACFSADSRFLVMGTSIQPGIEVYDLVQCGASGSERIALSAAASAVVTSYKSNDCAYDHGVSHVSFLPSNPSLLVCATSANIRIISLPLMQVMASIAHTGDPMIRVSSDGRYIMGLCGTVYKVTL